MKKRIAITIASVVVLITAYAFLGPYGIYMEECIKCGAWRTQLRIGSLPLLSFSRETDVSKWYRSFDTNHFTHAWGTVCGSEHTWYGWENYDNFGFTTAYAVRALHNRQSEMPAEELNKIMTSYVAADIASITGGVWRLPKYREEESQQSVPGYPPQGVGSPEP